MSIVIFSGLIQDLNKEELTYRRVANHRSVKGKAKSSSIRDMELWLEVLIT